MNPYKLDIEISYINVAKCRIRYRKRDLRHKFKLARSEFDKVYRREERKFKREQILDLETFCTSNPTEFWEKLKQLGPQAKTGSI